MGMGVSNWTMLKNGKICIHIQSSSYRHTISVRSKTKCAQCVWIEQDACQNLRTRNVTRLLSKIKDPECLPCCTARRVKCLLGNFNLFRVCSWSSYTFWNSWSWYSFWSHFLIIICSQSSGSLNICTSVLRAHARILKYWMKIAKKVRSINISRSQNCLLIWIMGLWFFIKWPFFAAVRFTILLTVNTHFVNSQKFFEQSVTLIADKKATPLGASIAHT